MLLRPFCSLVELSILGGGPPNNHCDIENFLRANGCEKLVPWFIAEEIDERQIAQLSDQDLICLGVRTIGARLRLRSAAASWEPPQVYLFSFLTFLWFSAIKWFHDQCHIFCTCESSNVKGGRPSRSRWPVWRWPGTGKNCDVIFQCAFSATFQMKNSCHKLLFTISLRFCEFLAVEWFHD